MELSEKKAESLHAGHRQRMLASYLRTGLEGFSDVETLELLLGYAISRRDVNPIAHALLDEFGDLHRVLNAPIQQLVKVSGVGERSAVLIHLVGELWTKSESIRFGKNVFLRNTQELGSYLALRSVGLREERAWLLSLDAKCKVIECRELCRGSVNAVNLPFRKLVEAALLANASSVVLAHNHTTGTMIPSLEDVEYTRDARRALAMVDVVLTDHVILCDGSFLSMRASQMMEF
jgi:DNA repair protein RadC